MSQVRNVAGRNVFRKKCCTIVVKHLFTPWRAKTKFLVHFASSNNVTSFCKKQELNCFTTSDNITFEMSSQFVKFTCQILIFFDNSAKK